MTKTPIEIEDTAIDGMLPMAMLPWRTSVAIAANTSLAGAERLESFITKTGSLLYLKKPRLAAEHLQSSFAFVQDFKPAAPDAFEAPLRNAARGPAFDRGSWLGRSQSISPELDAANPEESSVEYGAISVKVSSMG